MPRSSVEQRFWAKVQGGDPEQCWLWVGSRTPQGYGRFGVNGKNVSTHRWAYEHMRAPIVPAWLNIDHLCSNPPCVNPWHLEPVTHDANMKRSVMRGRHRFPKVPRVESGVVVDVPPAPPWIFRHIDQGVHIAFPEGDLVLWATTEEYEQLASAAFAAARSPDDLPPLGRRRAGQVFFIIDGNRFVMWAEQPDWIPVEPDGRGGWRVQGAGLYVAEEKT